MPWKESSVMDERTKFISRLLEGESMTHVSGCTKEQFFKQVKVLEYIRAISFFEATEIFYKG